MIHNDLLSAQPMSTPLKSDRDEGNAEANSHLLSDLLVSVFLVTRIIRTLTDVIGTRFTSLILRGIIMVQPPALRSSSPPKYPAAAMNADPKPSRPDRDTVLHLPSHPLPPVSIRPMPEEG